MFQVNDDDMSIYLTRGDTALFQVSAMKSETERYVFKAGDVVRIKVFEKKACDKVVLQKDFGIEEDTEVATVFLNERETKFGEVISKPTDYWYEIELNPFTEPQTIVGYDDDGAKILKLFPEGADVPDIPIEEEDIPIVDKELDLTSTRPVQNQAIARAFKNTESVLNARINQIIREELPTPSLETKGEISIECGTGLIVNLASNGADVNVMYEFNEFALNGSTSGVITVSNDDMKKLFRPLVPEGYLLFEKDFATDKFTAHFEYYKRENGNDEIRVNATNKSQDTLANTYGVLTYPVASFANPYAEIEDAKVGADGTVYETLGDSIREQAKKGSSSSSTARIGEATLLADNWTGENNLYSQVVNIDGVTENTQVDLTPSVEQLAVFYEKDLAFVTENEDGVVTVYAIGQKPTNDYTIQVTMTEVVYE